MTSKSDLKKKQKTNMIHSENEENITSEKKKICKSMSTMCNYANIIKNVNEMEIF